MAQSFYRTVESKSRSIVSNAVRSFGQVSIDMVDPPFPHHCTTHNCQPRVVPPVEIAGTGEDSEHPLPSIYNDKDLLDVKASAFSNLLRADIGQSLGVPLDAVDLEGVSPAGETIVDWQSWPQWAEGSLNVSRIRREGGRGATKSTFWS